MLTLLKNFFRRLAKPNLHVYSARMTGAGKLIEIRYRITRAGRPGVPGAGSLTPEGSGENLRMLLAESPGADQTRPGKNRICNALFYNRDTLVKPGSKVTFRLGGLSAKGIAIK